MSLCALSRFSHSPGVSRRSITAPAVEGAKTFLSLMHGLFRFARETLFRLHRLWRPPWDCFLPVLRWVYYSQLWGEMCPSFCGRLNPFYICGIEIGEVSSHDQMGFWIRTRDALNLLGSGKYWRLCHIGDYQWTGGSETNTYLKHKKRKKAMSSATMEMQWPRKFMITAIW